MMRVVSFALVALMGFGTAALAEDVAEEASFTVGSSDEPLLETEDEEDAVPIEPGAADAPGN